MARWVEKRFSDSSAGYGAISSWLNEMEEQGELLDVYVVPVEADILVLVRLDEGEDEEEATSYVLNTSVFNNVN